MTQEINLLPTGPSRGAPSASSSSLNTFAYGVVGVAALLAVMGVYENQRLGALRNQAQAVERALTEARDSNAKALGQAKSRKPETAFEAELAELEAQFKSRQEVVEALRGGVLGTTAGFSQYMLALSRQTLTGVWLTAFDLAAGGAELTLAGRALSAELVPVYLQRLTQEAPLQGRRFGSMQISQPAGSETAAAETAAPGKSREARRGPAFVEFRISSEVSGAPSTQTAVQPSASPAPVPEPAAKGEASK